MFKFSVHTGGVESAVSDAAVNPERIAQLTDQINQQKAAIAQHQAEFNKWMGTTAQLEASHYAAATAIASEDKITELEQQLQPLLDAQQAAGKNATEYAAATDETVWLPTRALSSPVRRTDARLSLRPARTSPATPSPRLARHWF